jgi:signal transduction histidine kinase
MDIRLAVTSAGIFMGIYALTLGIPFFLFFKGYGIAAMVLMGVFATGAPFIYSRLRKQAEDRILEEQKTYQDILLKASQGLTRLKKVEEITHFVVNVILKAIRIKSAGFYLFDGQKYVLKDRDGDVTAYAAELPDRSPVVDYLNYHGAVFLDELKQANPNGAEAFNKVREFFRVHPANVAAPVMRDGKVFGLIFLGEKANNTSYSDRDLTVLTVIADQMALAMENAIHLEMTKKDFIEQMHDRRLKDVGLLGSTISHQMCNRLQKITLAIEYAQSVFNDKALESDTREALVTKLRESLGDFERMKREALSAAEISDALKTFSKSGTEPSAVPLKRVVKMAKDLVDAKHKDFAYEFVEEYDPDLTLWVNISAMQDVLFNAFDNSLDAIKIKQKSGNCPAGYAPLISVKAHANGSLAVVEVTDNGVGFRPEDLEKVFIPFFTTKGTLEGTGLGLHAMRELVRRNNGDIVITSEFFQWARVTINLPLATEERINATGK